MDEQEPASAAVVEVKACTICGAVTGITFAGGAGYNGSEKHLDWHHREMKASYGRNV